MSGRDRSTVATPKSPGSNLAEEWWDPRGKMAVLHKFNPVRLAYITRRGLQAFRAQSRSISIA